MDLSGGGAPPPAGPHPAAGGDTRGYSVSQAFSTAGSTKEPGEPNHCGQPGGASQWYVYTTPAAGTFHADTAGSTFNTILAVYTGSGASFTNLTAVACGFTTNYLTQGQPSLTLAGIPANTKFFVVVDGYRGASGTAVLHLSVGQPPVIVAAPVSTPAGPNSRATFSVAAIGSTNLAYQWQFNGVPLRGAAAATLVVTNAQNNSVGNYSVIVSNAIGVVTSAPAALTIQSQPFITQPPATMTVKDGQKISLSVVAGGSAPLTYQWFKNGNPIAKATKSTLAFAPVRFPDAGSYTVTVSNPLGNQPSAAPAVLTVLEAAPPAFAITAPASKFATTAASVTVKGTAVDPYGLSAITLTVNNMPVPVAAARNWSASVPLVPGANTIVAQAFNLSGLASVARTVAVFYTVNSPLTLLASGPGAISGAPRGGVVPVGAAYTVTAVPAKNNSVFQNWTAGPDSNSLTHLSDSAKLTFVMSSNLVLQANFITNPFPVVAGSYNGLFYPMTSAVTEQSSGFVTLSIDSKSKGVFSGRLSLDGGNYPFSGTFSGPGDSVTTLARAGKTPVSVALHINLDSPDDQISGSVSNAAWVAALQADRAVFSAAHPATDYSNRFTIVIPPGPLAPTNQPAGYGYLAMSNSAAGNSTIAGALADGAIVSQSVPISGDGFVPLYASLYGGKGSISGWLNITNLPPQALGGAVNWFKPATAAKTLFPAGFAYQAEVSASPLLLLNNSLLSLTNLIISESDWSSALNYELAAAAANTLSVSASPANPTNKVAVSLTPASGVITVAFRPTGAKKDVTAKGVVLPQQQNAFGWFTNGAQTGFFPLALTRGRRHPCAMVRRLVECHHS